MLAERDIEGAHNLACVGRIRKESSSTLMLAEDRRERNAKRSKPEDREPKSARRAGLGCLGRCRNWAHLRSLTRETRIRSQCSTF